MCRKCQDMVRRVQEAAPYRNPAGGAHPRVASLGLRPIHLQPLPYGFYRNGSISLVGEALGPPAGTCLPKRRAGEGTRPYGGSKRRAESSRPTGFNSGKLAQQTQAQFLNRTSGKFSPTQGPSGPGLKRRQALLVLRAGNDALTINSASPVTGVRGKATMSTKCSSEPSPVAFCLLCRHGQSRSPPALRPQARFGAHCSP